MAFNSSKVNLGRWDGAWGIVGLPNGIRVLVEEGGNFYPWGGLGCRMDNIDAKVTIRGTLHTLTSIKELLGQTGNERCGTRFCSTVFGKWLDFPAYSNDNLLLNYIFQHAVKQEQNNDVCPPIRYKIGNNHFDRQEFCLITGFAFGKIPKVDTFNGLQNSPFCDRVFPDKIAEPLKKVRVSEVLEVIRSPERWSALSDEDSVKCLGCIPMGIIFLERFVPKAKKIDSSKKIETYNVYGFIWSLKIYILEMYRNSKFWWKKDPLVIPRGLAWSKIDGQPNGPITASPEGIQLMIEAAVVHDPQFEQQPKQVVESVPLFTSEELVAEYHSITTTVQLIENVGDGDPSIVLKELAAVKQRMNVIELFIKSRNDNLLEDSVAKQYVEKEIEFSDGKADSAISNVLIGEISCQNLFQEQLQCRDMLGESEIINVLTSQVSCDKYVGGFYECESSKLYYTDPKEYPSSSMTQLLEAAVPEQTSSQMLAYTPVDLNLPNLNESFTESQVNEYVEYDFDNLENDSLSDMVKIGEEEIHLDGSEIVDDPFVQIPDKQYFEHLEAWFELMWRFRPKDADWAIASSYLCGFVMRGDIPGWVCNEVTYPVMWADVEQVFFSINEANKHYCLGVLHIRTGVITLYDWLFSEAV
ncbi:hypothetical protein Tco_0809205 [Tanacetum coccineum]